MSKDRITTLFLFAVLSYLNAQPEVTSWTLNCDGITGYGNILANVQAIHYTEDYVYVSSTCPQAIPINSSNDIYLII